MAEDEEKILSEALSYAFKRPTRLSPDLYVKMHHVLIIDDSASLKLNVTMKRGLVLELEADSMLSSFLTIGDIVLTVNGKAVCRADFRLPDAFKENKTVAFSYIRLRNYSAEEPVLAAGERREAYAYKVAVIYSLQRLPLGLVLEGFEDRVYITSAAACSLGAMCAAAVGDVILQVNGQRVTDTDKARSIIAEELETKTHFTVTLERARSDEARAHVAFVIGKKESRDPPLPADCFDYLQQALAALHLPEPRDSLRNPQSLPDPSASVGFHDQIAIESVIPSDVAAEALMKTPSYAPSVSVAASTPPPAPQEKREQSVMSRVLDTPTKQLSVVECKSSIQSVTQKLKLRSDSTKKTSGAKTPTSGSKTPQRGRKKLSTELFFNRSKKKQPAGGTLEARKKERRKRTKQSNTRTCNTEESDKSKN